MGKKKTAFEEEITKRRAALEDDDDFGIVSDFDDDEEFGSDTNVSSLSRSGSGAESNRSASTGSRVSLPAINDRMMAAASAKANKRKYDDDDAEADAAFEIQKLTTSVAASTEQTVATAMKISKEIDKGTKEDPAKLATLAQQTTRKLQDTNRDISALNTFLNKKAGVLRQLPEERQSAQRIVEVARESVDFAQSEVTLANAAAARDAAVKAAKNAVNFAQARVNAAKKPVVAVGKIKDNQEMRAAAAFLTTFTGRVVNSTQQTINTAQAITQEVARGHMEDPARLQRLATETVENVAHTVRDLRELTSALEQRGTNATITQAVEPIIAAAETALVAAQQELRVVDAEVKAKAAEATAAEKKAEIVKTIKIDFGKIKF